VEIETALDSTPLDEPVVEDETALEEPAAEEAQGNGDEAQATLPADLDRLEETGVMDGVVEALLSDLSEGECVEETQREEEEVVDEGAEKDREGGTDHPHEESSPEVVEAEVGVIRERNPGDSRIVIALDSQVTTQDSSISHATSQDVGMILPEHRSPPEEEEEQDVATPITARPSPPKRRVLPWQIGVRAPMANPLSAKRTGEGDGESAERSHLKRARSPERVMVAEEGGDQGPHTSIAQEGRREGMAIRREEVEEAVRVRDVLLSEEADHFFRSVHTLAQQTGATAAQVMETLWRCSGDWEVARSSIRERIEESIWEDKEMDGLYSQWEGTPEEDGVILGAEGTRLYAAVVRDRGKEECRARRAFLFNPTLPGR
jgi:hypothetical protein